jgi:hypothetical protein
MRSMKPMKPLPILAVYARTSHAHTHTSEKGKGFIAFMPSLNEAYEAFSGFGRMP